MTFSSNVSSRCFWPGHSGQPWNGYHTLYPWRMNVDLPNLGNLDIGQLQQYLQGVNFPAQKEEVASNAESNGAPQNIVDGIRNAAQDKFTSQDEVLQAVKG